MERRQFSKGIFTVRAANVVLLLAIFLCAYAPAFSQQNKGEVKEHEQQVRDMVKFLEYVLNTLGSKESSARDKDVLVTESYTKIFRDGKVQVEDDLVEKRNVITYKDVQAYLKDVDFFFDDVKFELNIKDIKGSVNANGKLYYKVSINRTLKGTSVDGDVISNASPRFIEINYDPNDKDLRIVSIYTKTFDQRGALLTWWNSLPIEWQSFFKKRVNIMADTVDVTDIQDIMSINSIDLSHNQYLRDLEPISQLSDLQILNLSYTPVEDLSPLRNLTGLTDLNISNTPVQDLTPLKYADNLVKLNISKTAVTELIALERMSKLERLEMEMTSVADFAPLANNTSLKYLDIQRTKVISLAPLTALTNLVELDATGTIVDDLTPLSPLKGLTTLTLDSTNVATVAPLAGNENLTALSINYTRVADIAPLQSLKKLTRIYCDHTGIKRPLADAFMSANPNVLVVFDSEDLRGWWTGLSDAWKTVFSKAASISMDPTNEELAKIPNIDTLNLTGNKALKDLEPLRQVQKLKGLAINQTSVADLSPLKDHRALRALDISETQVSSIDVLQGLNKMQILRADQTPLTGIDALAGISSIRRVYVDKTMVTDSLVQDFLLKQPQCLVIYKSDTLSTWWDQLPGAWRDVFEKHTTLGTATRKEDLHKLVETEIIRFRDAPVSNLSVLDVFIRLRELDFSGTLINDVSPLIGLKSLKTLKATNSPIRNLEPLRSMPDITDLDVSNTPVDELRPIRGLQSLKTLNCSGTQVSSLSALEDLQVLESLDVSNTGVKKIDPLENLPLKSLKCYNTKISGKSVSKFREAHPDCNVVHY